MMIMQVGDVTLILMKDGTYVVPKEPKHCNRCLAMSGAFLNRNGDTFCVRCDGEERTVRQEAKAA